MRLRPRADRALRRRCAPAPRARGAASREASPCPRRAGSGDRPEWRGARSPEPAGRNTRAARFFFEVGDRLLPCDDLQLQAIELGDRLLTIAFDDGALSG